MTSAGNHVRQRQQSRADSSARVALSEPVSPPSAVKHGASRALWVAILSALVIFSALGAYVWRTHNSGAATPETAPTATAPAPGNTQPSPNTPAPTAEPAAVSAASRVIAARAADGIWADLTPDHRANLCTAYGKHPREAIRGAFLKMATSEQATFTAEGATPVQVWQHLEKRLKKLC